MSSRAEQVSRILEVESDPHTPSRLLPLIYEELRELARARLANEPPGQTLQATALVHEAYLRLLGDDDQHWNNRGHFFGAAAEAMRRILIERARRRASAKHGGDWHRISMSGLADASQEDFDDRILALDQAITRLEDLSPLRAQVVKLRFFAGLTIDDTAMALKVSPATIRRHWAVARAWLAYQVKTNEN